MTRTLETVLIGRDLLSPVLTRAGGEVRAFDRTVQTGAVQTANTVEAAVARQRAAQASYQKMLADTAAAATTQRTASASLVAAREREVAAIAVLTKAEERLSALRAAGVTSGMRLALAEDNVAVAQMRASAATSTRARASSTLADADFVLATANNLVATTEDRVATSSGRTTVAMRAQQAATGALASANGLLGTSLTPLTAGLGAVALGLGYATFRGAQFDAAMSAVGAATMATGGQMEQLRDLAIELGGATQYSAEEAADGITELAKAGVSTADILGGGLKGALDLAARERKMTASIWRRPWGRQSS